MDTIPTTITKAGYFEGDGADPDSVPEADLKAIDSVVYSLSLNYNRLAASVLSPVTGWHWYDHIPHSNVILGAVPSKHLLVKLKQDPNIRLGKVVNMCAEFHGHLETMRENNIVQCWIPTPDFHVPTVEGIWTGVTFIAKYESDGQQPTGSERESIYLHCKAGKGRSATVALCWLFFTYKLSAQQAQVILLRARGQVDRTIYLHPEVVSFCDQVLAQELAGDLHRRPWPEAS